MLGYDETLREVRRRHQQEPDRYFYCDQYGNGNNPSAHYETTAEEILRQAPRITHFVAGVGTGGTISGVGRRPQGEQPGRARGPHQLRRVAGRGGSEAPGARATSCPTPSTRASWTRRSP